MNQHHIMPAPFMHRHCHKHNKVDFNAVLVRSEIAYDIHFFTYKVARIAFAEAVNEDRKEAVLKKDTADWLDRHITTAIAKLRKEIIFASPRTSAMPTDEILTSPEQFLIPLSFDDEWTGDPQNLCDNIHDFIVKQCIADWAMFALNNRYEEFQTIADTALSEVHDIACAYIVSPISSSLI